MANLKRESVYQVTKFSLFLMFIIHYFYKKSQLFHSIRIHKNCFELSVFICFFFFFLRDSKSLYRYNTYPHSECGSRLKFEKQNFSAFPDGMETLYTQFVLFGYFPGNPGLVKVLFITEPHPTKSHSNFTHQMKIS